MRGRAFIRSEVFPAQHAKGIKAIFRVFSRISLLTFTHFLSSVK
jgi:hypothetical protein